jgi:hypothetical protein
MNVHQMSGSFLEINGAGVDRLTGDSQPQEAPFVGDAI